MSTTFKASVTRNSNGTIELRPLDGGNVPGKLDQGTEVEVTVDIVRTAKEVSDAVDAKKKSARAAAERAADEDPQAGVARKSPSKK